jgi:hypothetical protein
MKNTIVRSQMQATMTAMFQSNARLLPIVEPSKLPENLEQWLRNLQILKGVPFNYLVPDEGMLPPESIRFFYLDPNWMDALIDGAFSIGRNLTLDEASPIFAIDAAAGPGLRLNLRVNAAALRSAHLGLPAPMTTLKVVTGFILRSSLVPAYPGMGVYAYDDAGGTLEILRFERLGQDSETIFCLIDGDAAQIDLHEAPEQLHYGIDEYELSSGNVSAFKYVRPFTITNNEVKIEKNGIKTDISGCFRAEAPRTLRMANLAATLQPVADPDLPVPYLNAAQMGFEMTQGVGLVSFISSGVKS